MDELNDDLLKGKLTWEKLADGRLWRLKAGKHFEGKVEDFAEDVFDAARLMGKAALTLKDLFGVKRSYLWVQFADVKILIGQPCPFCDSDDFVRQRESIATCAGCGARVLLQKSVQTGRRAHWRKDITQFSDVKLRLIDRRSDCERYAGYGTAPDGRLRLLYVDYLVDKNGKRLMDAEGAPLYRMGSFLADGFEDALSLEGFDDDLGLVHVVDVTEDDDDDE